MPPSEVRDGLQRTDGRPSLGQAVSQPGTIKINVQGAFIVDDDERRSPDILGLENDDGDPAYEFEHDRDIRLPNHTAVVSHVAVDVRQALASTRTGL